MGKRALKNQSKVSVSPLYPTVSFTGLRLNSPHQRSFQNLFLMTPSQTDFSLSTYSRNFIMSILHSQEKYVFYVNYYKDSIPFPILNIKEFLSNEMKNKVLEYFNKVDIVNNIVTAFTQKKILTSSGNMFNFITMFKMDAKIAVLTNVIYEDETLLLCERQWNQIPIVSSLL